MTVSVTYICTIRYSSSSQQIIEMLWGELSGELFLRSVCRFDCCTTWQQA